VSEEGAVVAPSTSPALSSGSVQGPRWMATAFSVSCLAYEPFWLVNEPQLSTSPELAARHARVLRVGGTSFAMYVIRNLQRHGKHAYAARLADGQLQTGRCLFTATQVEGLHAALYFLRQYSDGLLKAERNE